MLTIRIETSDDNSSHEGVDFIVNGKLVGSSQNLAKDNWVSRDDMAAKVRQSNVYRNLPRIVLEMKRQLERSVSMPGSDGMKPADKQRKFCEGLVDGLQRRTVAHAEEGVPDVRPQASPPYDAGYQYGEAITRCIQYIDDIERKVAGNNGHQDEHSVV